MWDLRIWWRQGWKGFYKEKPDDDDMSEQTKQMFNHRSGLSAKVFARSVSQPLGRSDIISCSYSLLESGPLTLLPQHVKHSTHSIQNALKWPPAPVIMITSRLVNNALRSPRHVSTSVWQSKCHWASDPVFLTTSARSKMAIHCQRLLKRRKNLHRLEEGIKRDERLSFTRKLPLPASPMETPWIWILHLRNPQRWIPARSNQSCPLLHLNPDLWTRNPMILKTISAPSPLLMPTTSTPSASASQFPAYASPPNPFLLQEITQQWPVSKSRKHHLVARQPPAPMILQCVKTVASHSLTGHISAVIKMMMTKIANVRAHAVQDLMKIF